MPTKPLKPCAHRTCPNLVATGVAYCDDHAHLRWKGRASAARRGYDIKWKRFRQWYLLSAMQKDPTCRHCKKPFLKTSDIEIDHIVPIRVNPKLKYTIGNLQPLCGNCHKTKTARDRTKYEEY